MQIVPLKLPVQPVVDFAYSLSFYSTATKDIPMGANRDWLGFDDGARALPGGIPNSKIVRRGIYTPDVGFPESEIAEFEAVREPLAAGRAADPGRTGAARSATDSTLGVVASITHSYREQFVEEDRRFFRIGDDNDLDATSDYHMQTGTQKAQLGIVGNLSWFAPSQRVTFENFYTHGGRDEGRFFEGQNADNARDCGISGCSSSRKS